jgi:hypothetical protein
MIVDNINSFGLLALLIIELLLMFKCLKYWLQIKSVLKDEVDGVSLYSQKELNIAGESRDFKKGYGMIFSNMSVSAKILFSPKTDNPKLSGPVKGIRRSIFLFLVTPLIFAVVLIFTTALMI